MVDKYYASASSKRPDYVVLVGCEEILFPSILMGASGGMIATSGIIPEVIVDLYDKAFAGDIEGARILQYRILDLINMMLLGVNFPEGFKTGVRKRFRCWSCSNFFYEGRNGTPYESRITDWVYFERYGIFCTGCESMSDNEYTSDSRPLNA